MATVLENVDVRVHVRYDGRSFDIPVAGLDISDSPTDTEILGAASAHLTREIGNAVNLSGYVVDRHEANGLYDVHPTAKFGYKGGK